MSSIEEKKKCSGQVSRASSGSGTAQFAPRYRILTIFSSIIISISFQMLLKYPSKEKDGSEITPLSGWSRDSKSRRFFISRLTSFLCYEDASFKKLGYRWRTPTSKLLAVYHYSIVDY